MSQRLKYVACILLGTMLVLLVPSVLVFSSSPPGVVEAAQSEGIKTGSGCTSLTLDLKAATTMPVPDFCIDGLCKLILYTDAFMGAFSPGYSWEVYYFQLDGFGHRWSGGPNMDFGGVSFSDGIGYNGNGIAEGVFLGGMTSDGGFVRILDDGPAENSPDLWTIESQASKSLTQATLQVCAIPGEEWSGYITETTSIDVPDFCINGLCMILRFTNATFGEWGPGLSMPVYYQQVNQEWVGGPDVGFGGVHFGQALGKNGTIVERIFYGGTAEGGGYASLYDDGMEYDQNQWSIYYQSDDELSELFYYFAPMDCTSHFINQQYTNIPPMACLGSLCTILRWTDATFGMFGPGFFWPVNYKQDTSTQAWVGGPVLAFGGVSFSTGFGVNGDTAAEIILDGGRTSDEGYVVLRDDSVTAGETSTLLWNVVFKPTTSLTMANYWVCSNTCQETFFLMEKNYIPLINR